jgi:signal transduction histidine kinase
MVTVPRFEDAAGMILSPANRDRLGAVVLVSAGIASFVFHLGRIFGDPPNQIALVFGGVVPLVLAALLIVGGVWLAKTGYDGLGLRIGAWCFVGVGLLTGIILVTFRYQTALGVELRNVEIVFSATATGGGIVGSLIGVYDAERRLTERQVVEERETAERLSQRLTVLNRVLRHDIRNDVTVIHGNADRIIEGAEDEEPARIIKRRARDLHRLSESARDIESLIELDDVPTEPVDMAPLLEDETRRLRRYGDVELRSSIPDHAWASATPKIDVAVGHIVENAIEHNDSESPRIDIEVTVRETTVEVTVADNGPGFPEEERAVLERGHETEIEHTSGLGLWLADWLVAESDGEITFESHESEGSVVSIRLPQATPPQ